MSDLAHMRRALELAGQAAGLTSPNPMVGAVVVRDGVVVGEGYHRAAGEAHAEVEALRAAGARARGATLYVTLEPCSHHGRTPPCAPLLVEAGVARVVVAMGDPNPRVSGRGLELLRRAGIAVDQGVATDEARRLNRAFCTWVTQGRPHVTLKSAVTLDGKIADVHGGSRWITGEDARAETHRLRSLSDAILVGIRTALADDPALTVRLPQPWPREPYRIVLDPRARLSPEARVVMSGTPAKTIVAVGDQASSEALERLRISGATVVHCPPDGAGLDLRHLLRWLAARGVASLLVEGGGETSATFLESGLVDRVAVFVAPMLLGGRAAPTAVGGQGRALKDALRLRDVTVRRLGADVLIEGDVGVEGDASLSRSGRLASAAARTAGPPRDSPQDEDRVAPAWQCEVSRRRAEPDESEIDRPGRAERGKSRKPSQMNPKLTDRKSGTRTAAEDKPDE